jgi:predicted ATPase/class 3 adenylate cyclase
MTTLSSQSVQIRTFLYTDLEGSTRLWGQFPDSIGAAIARHDEILRYAVEKCAGSIFRVVGDGICAVFVNASQALEAALQAQIALQAEPWGEIGSLNVRMAIHTGEVQAYGNDFIGSGLNRIGRLLAAAYGGQTLVSQATQLLVQDSLPPKSSLLDLGEVRLRDLTSSEHVYQLVHPELQSKFPPLVSLDQIPNNLPVQPTALIGREVELEEITKRLNSDQVRLLTLTGPGGTGKTRLGIQVASELIDRFKDGVYIVDLAPIRDPDGVLPAVARTVGIRKTSHRSILEELMERLRDQVMLVLLDNFEQVTSAANQVVELLIGCPQIKILVTSREALRVRVEHVFPLPPLTLPEAGDKHTSLEIFGKSAAVRLFVERAQAVKPDFMLTRENAAIVAEICIRLDGLPLAIELAASRIKLFPPQALLERLSSRLKLLTGGARDLPARQQTLRDTIGWSYDLLEAAGKQLFEFLSIFPGGCTFEAFETIASTVEPIKEAQVDVIEGVVSLLDKSLLRQVSDANEEPRLVMFGTIRDYALERLEENPVLSAAAYKAHAEYYADFTRDQWRYLSGESSEDALKHMDLELENIRAAWRFWFAAENLEQLDKINDSLWLIYETRGWYKAMLSLTQDLLDVLASTSITPERAIRKIVLQTNLASTLLITKGYLSTDVEQAFARAFELIEEQGEIPQLFPVLRGLARYFSYRGEYQKAIRVGEQILNLAEQGNDPDLFVAGHLILGTNLTFYEGLRAGLDHFEKGIAHYVPEIHRSRHSRFGSDPGVSCYITSAINLWMLGFPDTALKRANDTKDLAKRLHHPFSIAYATFHTGLLYLWTCEPDLALEHSQAVLELVDEHEFDIWKAVGLCLQGAALVRLGKMDEGLAQIIQGMEKYQGLKTPPIFWTLLIFNQAEAYLYAGKPERGLTLLTESMSTVHQDEEGALGAEFYRLTGDLLLAVSPENATEAENIYQHAHEISQKQSARLLELRVSTRLCRLWLEQGKHDQAYQVLSKAFQAMTEGFELADLKEAKELLDVIEHESGYSPTYP